MKSFFIFLLAVISTQTLKAQVVTYDDFKSIIPYLEQEDYKSAFGKSDTLLSTTQNDSSEMRAIVTYMNIFSAAGMVSTDEMNYDELEKIVKKYVGQNIIMTAHPCVDSTEDAFNSLQFRKIKDTLQGVTISTNNKAVNILCFEYFKYENPIYTLELIGQNVRCGGVLESFEVNPNKSKIWILRLHVIKAFARPA